MGWLFNRKITDPAAIQKISMGRRQQRRRERIHAYFARKIQVLQAKIYNLKNQEKVALKNA